MAKFSTEQEFINEVLAGFARQLLASRLRQVKGQKAIASKELLKSYAYEIRRATLQQTALAMIAFEEQGRFLDMRRLDRSQKQIPIDALKKWIKDVGLESFKKKPGKAARPLNGQRLLNALAWGIAKKVKQRGGYRKARRPLQKGTEALILNLIDELREGFLDRTVEEIKSSLTQSFN